MSTTTTQSRAIVQPINGDELHALVGLYLCKGADIEVQQDAEGKFEADHTIWQLINSELHELDELGKRLPRPVLTASQSARPGAAVAMWVSDCMGFHIRPFKRPVWWLSAKLKPRKELGLDAG